MRPFLGTRILLHGSISFWAKNERAVASYCVTLRRLGALHLMMNSWRWLSAEAAAVAQAAAATKEAVFLGEFNDRCAQPGQARSHDI